MKIILQARAEDDLEKIYAWIAKDSPRNADEVIERIYKSMEVLRMFPRSGRVGRLEGTSELKVPRLPYVLVYTVDEQAIAIRAVFHTARMRE